MLSAFEDLEFFINEIDPRYRPAFQKLSIEHKIAYLRYFFNYNPKKYKQVREKRYLDHHTKQLSGRKPTHPRVVHWYDPFASQNEFPSAQRFAINTSKGCCGHIVLFCYTSQITSLSKEKN